VAYVHSLSGCSSNPGSTHSLVALSAVAALSGPFMALQPLYGGAVVGGYGSHLWIDRLNIRGVVLFWPAPVRRVTPGHRNGRLEVGSKGEMILLSTLLVAAAALYPLSHLGFRDALHALPTSGKAVISGRILFRSD
jgi:inner membrane protein